MELLILQKRIYEVRGQKVMLDFDLAILYGIETKALNQAVKRNLDRFPDDFIFRLTLVEWQSMRSHIVTASEIDGKPSQNKRNIKITPFAFTEHGVGMLASVLRSETAAKMNIGIVRAFIAMRKMYNQYADLLDQFDEIRLRLDQHDSQLNGIYQAIENLLDVKAGQESWKERSRIGFKK